jgi:hypothetical protein
MENASHNADQAARKAEMIKRAQMAIDGRLGAVGCGHTDDAVKPATDAVSAQKKGILSGVGRHTTQCGVFGRRVAHFEKCLHRSARTLRSVF